MDPPVVELTDIHQSNDGGKVKKSRKRPKSGSCIPCAKRRQKCDRTQPCSSCVSRETPHLCKWEMVPDGIGPARIAQARVDSDLNENQEMLKRLSKRIKSLESRVVASGPGSGTTQRTPTSLESGSFVRTSPSANTGGFTAGYFDHVVSTPMSGTIMLQEIVPSAPQDESYSRVAAFSLVHRGEFLGRGNILSALHSIRSLSPLRLPHAKTTSPTNISVTYPVKFAQSLIPSPEVQHLIQYLPCVTSGNLMIDAFLKEVNWRYGIPEKWFSNTCNQMWNHLQTPLQGHQLNLYWLCLFFSVLACTPPLGESSILTTKPPNTHDRCTYFICASTARRLAEGAYLDQPLGPSSSNVATSSPTDGSVLACLAIPLLCDFLAERGKLSEAWKLVGSGIRSAQAIGLHRDPGDQRWQEMSEGEKDLRRRAWWGLYIWDRLYSYVLGRPQMIHGDISNVIKPANDDGKGRKNSFSLSRMVMIQLADLVSEILDKCTGVEGPTWTFLTEMDQKLQTWELSMPAEFRPGATQEQDIILFAGLSPSEIQNFTRQRYMITTWYRLTRLKLYTLALKGHTLSGPTRGATSEIVHSTAEKCSRCALELIKFQCDTFERMRRINYGERCLGGNWYFEGCLSLFEATVALCMVLTKFSAVFFVLPGTNLADEAKTGLKLEYEDMSKVIARVVGVFSEVVKSERESLGDVVNDYKRAELAARGLDAVQVLLKEHWWKLDPRVSMGRTVSTGTGLATDRLGSQVSMSPTSSGSAPSSQRQGSSPATGTLGAGNPFGGPGFVGSTMGSMHLMQQQVQSATTVTGQAPLRSPGQTYPGLMSTAGAQGMQPAPAIQQRQAQYQTYSSAYGNVPMYPMTTYGSAGSTSYAHQAGPSATPVSTGFDVQLSQGAMVEDPISVGAGSSTAGFSQNQPQFPPQSPHIQQNPTSPATDGPRNYALQNPFIPFSNQNQQYQQIPQRLPPPPQLSLFTSNPNQPSALVANSAAAAAYAYTPTSNMNAGQALTPPAPGVPPPSQGMRMIHYVAPKSGNASTTANVTATSPSTRFMDMGQSMEVVEPPGRQNSTIMLSEYVDTTPTQGIGTGSGPGTFYNQ
ncbi:hypothetical protein P691DRAFT_718360 [Macrolepiota fuliginosa MF-IS2]|uniref:Zn(2)-C6 fungal-type domain-containing protein n=1 Tax=Macrolepiota fuliginosa MF-IS2 TaxID=1400762 RepID=A0A9P5XNE0_9AGAR|nr:hypothetical protein P691DRAFT_718360 [Macrolepiota fuliginosa MF-IS2]